MTKLLKSLMAVCLLGVPIWLMLVSLSGDRPGSILIHLSEPNVRVCIGDQEFDAESTTIGPIELSPGEHRVRVIRGHETLYEYPMVVQGGQQREITAAWRRREIVAPRGEVLTDDSEQRLEGHLSGVVALDFARDGSWMTSASSDGAVRVWDAFQGREITLLKGNVGKVVALCAVTDQRQVITVGDDAVIRYWDIDSGRETRSCQTGILRQVVCASIARDGSRVALGCQGGVVIVYNLDRGVVERRHMIDPATPGGLAFSAGGETLLIGMIGDPRTPHDVLVLDIATGRLLARLQGHEAPVWSVAFLPDGRRAVSAGTDLTLRVWDIATGRELKRFDDHPGAILCLAVSPDGRLAITGTGHAWSGGWKTAGSYGLQVWDLEAGVGLGRFETSEPVRSVVLSPDGRRAFAAGEDRVIHSWNLPVASPEPAAVADQPDSSSSIDSVGPSEEPGPELVRFQPMEHSAVQPTGGETPGATAGTNVEILSRTVPQACIDIESAGPTRHSSSTSSSRVEKGM
jgi:WD40 repeat protein